MFSWNSLELRFQINECAPRGRPREIPHWRFWRILKEIGMWRSSWRNLHYNDKKVTKSAASGRNFSENGLFLRILEPFSRTKICNKTFPARRPLETHMRIHTGVKPYMIPMIPMIPMITPCEFTLVIKEYQYVKNISLRIAAWKDIWKFTQGRNHISVMSAEKNVYTETSTHHTHENSHRGETIPV